MERERDQPKVYSIPSGTPFLETLADALVAGRFGAVPGLGDDPFALADVTILLPTRRAARAFADILLARSPSGAVILPTIRPIGDVDEEEHLLAETSETPAERLLLPRAIGRVERLMVLTKLVMAWSTAIRRDLFDPVQDHRVPQSASGALRLAVDLARLIDDMETAGIPWDALETLVPDDYPEFRQVTLDFLKIAAEAWPRYLAERKLANPATRRDRLLRAEAARLVAHPPTAPIVAAGSTGSIPATAHLLATIARLPTGAVVLPGLDKGLDAESWSKIGATGEGAEPSHPQYGLKQLLAALGTPREAVEEIGEDGSRRERRRLISEMMRPAETTDRWAGASFGSEEALDGLAVVAARSDREEALAIALALREAIAEEGVTAALVTPDRDVARRVSAELGRWGIEVDDSAGTDLDSTPPAIFLRLLAEAAVSGGEPRALLSVAKHPLAAFGMPRPDCRRAAHALELALYRGGKPVGDVADLVEALAKARVSAKAGRRRDPAGRLGDAEWTLATRLARALADTFGPIQAVKDLRPVSHLTRLLLDAGRRAATDETGSDDRLWQGTAGASLATLLGELIDESAVSISLAPEEFPAFLSGIMGGVRVSRPPSGDPRLHIWGILEARLQPADVTILAGLDEGIWPAATRTDPWLSRTMRRQLGLEPPERRIGLSAHDFAEMLAGKRVIVTRADRRAGTPMIASRWLQRLYAVAGKEGTKVLEERGGRYLAWARSADTASEVKPLSRPEPRPPVPLRPRALSITEVETWIRDPYAIYARHVLRLDRLDPLGAPPDAADRGTLFHAILADFTTAGPDFFSDEDRLREIAKRHFATFETNPDTYAIWWLRWMDIATWFLGWEATRDRSIAERHAEIRGEYVFPAPAGSFTIRGRADRIDIARDGSVEIYDYKTGQTATPSQILQFAPQLGLEAAMVSAGAFGETFKDRPISVLAFIALARVKKDDWLRTALKAGMASAELAATTMAKLGALASAYDRPDQPYVSQARPMFERRFPGDYDHLARLAEWRHGSGEDE